MKRWIAFLLICISIPFFDACKETESAQIATTTLPVYEFTSAMCRGTDLSITRLVTESVSCLHDYTLQVHQLRAIESAELVVISGAGLEDFLPTIPEEKLVDASSGISLHCNETIHEHNDETEHHHDEDPHIWLSVSNAKHMCRNIRDGLIAQYPACKDLILQNYENLLVKLTALEEYGKTQLSGLKSNEIITFHDGFSYLAESYDISIIKAIEEESGSEASAAELKEIITIVQEHNFHAIFVETSGSVSAAEIISNETGAKIYTLDMIMSGDSYFDAMYRNIDILKEALG